MMQCSWGIYASLSWHKSSVSDTVFSVKHKCMDVPIIPLIFFPTLYQKSFFLYIAGLVQQTVQIVVRYAHTI